MRLVTAAGMAAALGAAGLAGCAAAAEGIPSETLGETARDAFVEARSMARAWDAEARLRYVEGQAVSPAGLVLPESGRWLFHYTAPGRTQELLVRVSALETASEERPATSPPGYVVGDNVLGPSWIDSPAVLEAVRVARPGGVAEPVSLLLVPTRPEQWVVRLPEAGERWRVQAETGEVLGS